MDPEEITYDQLAEYSESQPDLVDKLRELDEPKRQILAEREARFREERHFLETLDSLSD